MQYGGAAERRCECSNLFKAVVANVWGVFGQCFGAFRYFGRPRLSGGSLRLARAYGCALFRNGIGEVLVLRIPSTVVWWLGAALDDYQFHA